MRAAYTALLTFPCSGSSKKTKMDITILLCNTFKWLGRWTLPRYFFTATCTSIMSETNSYPSI